MGQTLDIAKRVLEKHLSARHPNSAARSRLVMFVCMSVTLQEFNYSHPADGTNS